MSCGCLLSTRVEIRGCRSLRRSLIAELSFKWKLLREEKCSDLYIVDQLVTFNIHVLFMPSLCICNSEFLCGPHVLALLTHGGPPDHVERPWTRVLVIGKRYKRHTNIICLLSSTFTTLFTLFSMNFLLFATMYIYVYIYICIK